MQRSVGKIVKFGSQIKQGSYNLNDVDHGIGERCVTRMKVDVKSYKLKLLKCTIAHCVVSAVL